MCVVGNILDYKANQWSKIDPQCVQYTHSFDISTSSPHYFCKKFMMTRKENFKLILGLKGFRNKHKFSFNQCDNETKMNSKKKGIPK